MGKAPLESFPDWLFQAQLLTLSAAVFGQSRQPVRRRYQNAIRSVIEP
jgi:hypothetical protein